MIQEGTRVKTKIEIAVGRKNVSVIPKGATGTVETMLHQFSSAWVRFDGREKMTLVALKNLAII